MVVRVVEGGNTNRHRSSEEGGGLNEGREKDEDGGLRLWA
jgi:hypothetical protein